MDRSRLHVIRTDAAIRLLALLLMAAPSCWDGARAQEPGVAAGPLPGNERLEAVTARFLRGHENVLGALVRLDTARGASCATAYGHLDIDQSEPAEPGDAFAIASVTKVFTAILVHQLVEEGRVDPGAPLIGYLPGAWRGVLEEIEHGPRVTVSQALAHRSGLLDGVDSMAFRRRVLADLSREWPHIAILEVARDEGKAQFEPGARYGYSSTNYVLLGALVENVTGRTFDQALRERVLARIGAKRTSLSAGRFGAGVARFATGYEELDGRRYATTSFDSGWSWSAGAITSDTRDLNRLMLALAAGRVFGSENTFGRMIAPTGDGAEMRYGLKVYRHGALGEYYGHAGYLAGTSTFVAFFPARDLAVSACITYRNGSERKVWAFHLIHHVLRETTGG